MLTILYISDVNSNEPIFHSQVVPHIVELKKSYNVILVGMCRGETYTYDYSYRSIPGDYILPLAFVNFLRQKQQLSRFLKLRIDIVYSRGFRGGLIGSFIKTFILRQGIKHINDVRADVLDEHKDSILKRNSFNLSIKYVFKNSDVLFFVSSKLRDKYVKVFNFNKLTATCPTFVPDGKFIFDQNIRIKIRQKLGYKDDDVVLLYSGNLAKWQNADLILEAFSQCRNKCIKLLFLTKDMSVNKLITNNENKAHITILSIEYQDIQNYYFAADYGLLIRDNTDTNKCSSPTKFSEYMNSGLPIIATEIESDYVDYLKKEQVNKILLPHKNLLAETINGLSQIERNKVEVNTLKKVVELQRIYFTNS